MVALGLVIAVLGGLGIVKTFFTDTMPWLIDAAFGWGAVAVALIAAVVALIYGLQYERYRSATKKLMWRYIIDVQDAQAGKPGMGAGQSEAVKRGEASADRAWGDRISSRRAAPSSGGRVPLTPPVARASSFATMSTKQAIASRDIGAR